MNTMCSGGDTKQHQLELLTLSNYCNEHFLTDITSQID